MIIMSTIEYSSPIDYSNNKITDGDDSGCGSSVCSNGSAITNTNSNINNQTGDTSDTNSDTKDSDNTSGKKRNPKCARCQNHDVLVAVKGHKRKCPYKDCVCKLCILTIDRRDLMAKTIAAKRRLQEDKADNCYIPPEYLPDKKIKRIPDDDNSMINSPKVRYSQNSPNLKEELNQITLSAVQLCFKKILDHLNEQFGKSLPNDWIDSLYNLREIEFAKIPVKDHLSLEVDNILRDAFVPVLEELRPKKLEKVEYRPKKLQIESDRSAFEKVVVNNNCQQITEYQQSLIGKKNSMSPMSPMNTKPKSVQSLQVFVEDESRSAHNSQQPLLHNCIPYYQNGVSSSGNHGYMLSSAYQPFVTTGAVSGFQLDSPYTPLPKTANISHTVYSMIANNGTYAKQSNSNNTETNSNNSNNCANNKYSAYNGISSTPKKKVLAQYMKVSK